MNHRKFLALALPLGVLLLASCSTTPPKLTAQQIAVRDQLARISPATDPLPAQTEIIDIHTHTFNARYLPLEGIILGKRDAFFPFTTLISDRASVLIARALVELTELAPGPQAAARIAADKGAVRRIRETEHPGLIGGIFLNLIDKAVKAGAWDEEPGARMAEKLPAKKAALDQVSTNMTWTERIAVRSAMKMMGMETYAESPKTDPRMLSDVQAAVRFVWTLTQNDAQLAEMYQREHDGVVCKRPIKMISHMMDLGPVYDENPRGAELLDFGAAQVSRMESYKNQPDPPLAYFVAYNPYRDSAPGSDPDAALQLVKDAVEKHGAIGVKIYPPSGYRPIGNDIKPRPWTLFTRYPGKQWDRRYLGFGETSKERNDRLDAELEKLLLWCIEKDLPVLVHSGYGEFQARKGYGVYHSNPLYWKKFLETHSAGGPCKLRLCLGHAGGEDFWFGKTEFEDWGKTARELCVTYPNVYCEVTTSGALLDPNTSALFADRLATLFNQPAADDKFPFSRSLLYGTDWPLPDRGEPKDVLEATQKIFLLPELRAHYADYFSANAKRFLSPGTAKEYRP